jgi:hypothetical protein
MAVNLFFYSAKDSMHLPVVFFVVAADLANERHQYKETTTDDSNHNFNRHVMQVDLGTQFYAGLCFSLLDRAMLDDIQSKVEHPKGHQRQFGSQFF